MNVGGNMRASTEAQQPVGTAENPHRNSHMKKKGQTQKFLTEDEERQYMRYKMHTDLFDFELLKQSETFAIKKYKESLYRGEIVGQLREGNGVCVYENGRLYEGAWV